VPENPGLTSLDAGVAAVGDFPKVDLAESWAELYRGVLRLRPVLEPPYADSEEGARVHAEFCTWLRTYLIRHGGADATCMARVEMEADVERENWHAVWSGAKTADPSAGR